MILTDFMGHMTSTDDADELHAFAKKIGLKREWYQTPGYGEEHAHYDLTTTRMRRKARMNGAVEVGPRELVESAWWKKK